MICGMRGTTTRMIAACALATLFLAPRARFGAADGSQGRTVRSLRLILVVSKAEEADSFNKLLKNDDILFTYGAKTDILQRVNGPRRMVGRGSVAELEREINKLGALRVDYVQYNPEHWKDSRTTKGELADLEGSVRKVRALAARCGAKLGFIPDNVLLEKHGEAVAPMVDLFGIQLQRYQREELDQFRKEAQRKVEIVRRGSTTVPIILQLSLAPPIWAERSRPGGGNQKVHVRDEEGRKAREPLPLETVLAQIDSVKDLADGIAFLYDPKTCEELKKLVALLRK